MSQAEMRGIEPLTCDARHDQTISMRRAPAEVPSTGRPPWLNRLPAFSSRERGE